jgi:hypothetical protein
LNVFGERGIITGWQTLSKVYWSDRAKKVETERPVYERFLKGIPGLQAQIPTNYTNFLLFLNISLIFTKAVLNSRYLIQLKLAG